ncbi:2-oxoglutarate dehydrogenase E1 subunit family protein, partial [Dermatophilus congolensis]
MSQQPPNDSPSTSFGANSWLVDEMYEQYKADKNSVDSSWWPLFQERD